MAPCRSISGVQVELFVFGSVMCGHLLDITSFIKAAPAK